MTNEKTTKPQHSQLIKFLIELRSRILKSFLVVFILFAILSIFSNDLFHFVALPLIKNLPEGSTMIATSVIPFLITLKLSIFVAIFIAIPFILYQIWAFIAPALYLKEKKFVIPLFISSILLFYLGILFAYYIVFPVMFDFISKTVPLDIKMYTDMGKYLDFVLKLFFAFGVCFEVPIIIILLCATGLSSTTSLSKKRPYLIILAFIIGMLLSPPDVISQTLLALPICILFEIGLIISKLILKNKNL